MPIIDLSRHQVRYDDFTKWVNSPRAASGAAIHEEFARLMNDEPIRGMTHLAAVYDDLSSFEQLRACHIFDQAVVEYTSMIRHGAEIHIARDRDPDFARMSTSFDFGYFEEKIHSLDGCKLGGCVICQNSTPIEGPPVTKFELMGD